MKFDKKDKIILESLFRDCRISLKDLSKKTNLTYSAVSYRIKKYEEEKLILSYDAIINFNKFKDICASFFVSIPNDISEKFEKYCLKNKNIMSLIGNIHKYNYSIFGVFDEKGEDELVNYFDKLGVNYLHYKYDTIYSFNLNVFDNIDNIREEKRAFSKKITLDNIDVKLMKNLFSGGARKSSMELARELNLRADLVAYRIRRLDRSGYFVRYIAQPNPEKFKMGWEVLSIEVNNNGYLNSKGDCVENVFERTGKCAFLFKSGENKYIASIFINGLKELKELLKKIYNELDNDLVKLDYYPTGDWIFLNRLDLDGYFEVKKSSNKTQPQ